MVKLGRELIALILLGLIPFISSTTSSGSSDSSDSAVSDTEYTPPPVTTTPLTFSMPLINYYNLQYSGQLQIGANQSLSLAFDTGSLWTVIDHSDFQENVAPNCTTSTCDLPGYGHVQTKTFDYITLSETIGGYIVSDSMTLNNQPAEINQTVLFSIASSPKFYNYSSGVCGLSLQNGNQTTILDNLYNSNVIGQKIFGLYLSNNPEAYGEDSSEIIFGGSNPSYYTGNFTNVSVLNGSSYWQTNLDRVILASETQTAQVKMRAISAIIVSGLKSILLPNDDFLNLIDTLSSNYQLSCFSDSSQTLSCNCPGGDVSSFPNISFVIDAQPFTIPPTLYLDITEDVCDVLIGGSLENVQGDFNPQNTNSSNSNNSATQSGTDSPDESGSGVVEKGTYIILGGAFLRNYYTIFDAQNRVISFAQVVPPSPGLISALQVIYLVFGSFIVILFIAFVGCGFRIIFSKKAIAAETGSPEKPLVEKRTGSQFVQGLEGN